MSEYQTPPPYARLVRSISPRRKRRKRRVLRLGGGGGGGDGAVGAAFLGGGGIEVGGAICTFPPGGGGGVNGTFSGGMVLLELGVAGVDASRPGETEGTGPGGGGVATVAVWLCEPGKTAASEFFMLGFILPPGRMTSARALYDVVSIGHEVY